MVVHQNRPPVDRGSRGGAALQLHQQDVPRGKDGPIRPENVTRTGADGIPSVGSPQESHIDPAMVGRFVMGDPPRLLAEGGLPKQLLQNEPILHLGHGHNIGHATRLTGRPQQGLCHRVTLCQKALFCPMPQSPSRELRIRFARSLIPVIKKILQVPKQHIQRIRLVRRHGRNPRQQAGQHPSSNFLFHPAKFGRIIRVNQFYTAICAKRPENAFQQRFRVYDVGDFFIYLWG